MKSDPDAAITLAAALVRVGRMTTSPQPAWMPALALYDGANLEERVRRLLAPAAEPNPARKVNPTVAICVGVATVGCVLSVAGTRPLHEVMEWAVRYLP